MADPAIHHGGDLYGPELVLNFFLGAQKRFMPPYNKRNARSFSFPSSRFGSELHFAMAAKDIIASAAARSAVMAGVVTVTDILVFLPPRK